MNDKKSVALLNIQRCNSHGAVLLAYALERIFISNGYDIQTLDYKYAGRIVEKNIIKRIFLKMKIKIKKEFHLTYMRKKILGLSLKKEYDFQTQNFSVFRKEFLHLTREIIDVNDEILKEYNAFVVGSDVVWKPEIAACEDKEIYFLKSVPKGAVKIAYAASIGTDSDEILKNYESDYVGAFDALDFISVREQSMIPYIQKFTSKKIVSVIDPIFLLRKEDYQTIEKNNQKSLCNRQYVYLYLLGINEKAIKEANRIAKENSYDILLDLSDGFELSRFITVPAESAISAGPCEFIYNIRNASIVITDSFHATAFSLLFNKTFYVFKRGTISVRMRDLVEKFGLLHLMCDDTIKDAEINWDLVNEQIEKERKKGIDYLLNALEGDGLFEG